MSPQDFAGPVYVVATGVVVAEAERLRRSDNWQLVTGAPTTDGSRASGDGWLRWTGYETTGPGREEDVAHALQGSRCDWLVLKFWVPEGQQGQYVWRSRNINFKEDGDNDYWAGYIGQPIGEPIERRGNRFRPAVGHSKFHYADNTLPPIGDGSAIVRRRFFAPGLHAVYFQGRSRGWGFDRLVVYRADDPAAERAALSSDTPESSTR